jgi:hypothetical protein
MPLAKHPRAVTASLEQIGHGLQVSPEKRTTAADIDRTITGCVKTG